MAEEFQVNMSDRKEKISFLSKCGAMQGRKRITIVADRPRRSDRQNRYYWPCFVVPLGEFMREQGVSVGDRNFTDDDAHELLKCRFLTVSTQPNENGEVFNFVRSTTTLNTAEFNLYLDECANFMAETFNIIVHEPSSYHEVDEQEAQHA